MTIVVAGYDEGDWASAWSNDASQALAPEDMSQAYILSDSRLSIGLGPHRRVVSDKAPKIERIPVAVAQPLFTPDGYTTDRVESRYTCSCGLAYSGNEFLGRTVMDRFRRAAELFEYTWISKTSTSEGHYAICSPESLDALRFSRTRYDRGIDFAHADLPPLPGILLVESLRQQMQAAADDILRHEKENDRLDDYLRTRFVLGTVCHLNKKVELHHASYKRDASVDPPWLNAVVEKVDRDGLVVLGQEGWKPDLEVVRDGARRARQQACGRMQLALKRCIANAEPKNFVGGDIQVGILTVQEGFSLTGMT